MPDEHDETQEDVTDEVTSEESEDSNPVRQMREALKRKDEELATYRQALMASAIEKAGFDLEDPKGKALARFYEGEADPEAIRKFASTELGYEVETETEQVRQVREGQQRVDNLQAASQPLDTDEVTERIAQAQDEGDWRTSLALKLQEARKRSPFTQ